MEKIEFSKKLNKKLNKINIDLNEKQINSFYEYMDLLLEWNEKINLTAITDKNEILQKHFVDSLTIAKHIKENSKIVDVGTGAGFPGIPIKILREDVDIVLLDSLNKRINFLNDVIEKINLKNINTIHGRVEEIGKNKKYREKFDVATSRAVANLSVLVEYMLPLVKLNGICICMKGSEVQEELENSKKAINELGGKIECVEEFELPESDIKRNIIIIRKIKETPSKYPRKPGTPSKEPIK
jgi:16S rRNA (guanine527-N7)-methyltransferase